MWVIRTYKCGRVIEKSKFWAPAGTRVRGGRVKGNTSAAKHDQNARQAVRVVARILNCNFATGTYTSPRSSTTATWQRSAATTKR